jgi:prepilin-type N-terminal cleavage/methylation domain-containing protein
MKKSKQKKAFTLTELLVVVIVIGVLSAVVLPKFSKVVETRKTTEAEELMSAVRTEQEKRCALDKSYVTSLTAVKDIVPSGTSKNYAYSLTSTGMEAQSKGKYGYTLKMPSYADGRICCENEAECAKLNKDYPLCSALMARADYRSGAECAGGEVQPEPEPAECTDGEVSGSQPCNDCGTQTTQKCVGGKWTASLGACSKTAEECAPAPEPAECTAGTVETGWSPAATAVLIRARAVRTAPGALGRVLGRENVLPAHPLWIPPGANLAI